MFRLRGVLFLAFGAFACQDGLCTQAAEAFKRPGRNREAWVNRNNYAAWEIIETPNEWPESGNDMSG